MQYQVQEGDTLPEIAERVYGDRRRYRAIAVANRLAGPCVVAGQRLEIPYVTYRHRVQPGDTKQRLAQRFYGDPALREVLTVGSDGAAYRDLVVGEWLQVPDINYLSGHTVRTGETLPVLSARWYGQAALWPVIAIVNRCTEIEPEPGTVLTRPRFNWRHTVGGGDSLRDLVIRYYSETDAERIGHLVELVAGANLIDAAEPLTVGQLLHFPSFDPWD